MMMVQMIYVHICGVHYYICKIFIAYSTVNIIYYGECKDGTKMNTKNNSRKYVFKCPFNVTTEESMSLQICSF